MQEILDNDILNLIMARRSIRKFKQIPVGRYAMIKLLDCARVAPSARNIQPLKYVVSDRPDVCKEIFPFTRWAGYLGPAGAPQQGEEPTAYISILVDKDLTDSVNLRDVGAAAENIMIAASAVGLASCFLGAINKAEISKILSLPVNLQLDSIIALGYAAHESEIYTCDDNVEYSMDEKGNFKVPKRSFSSIVWRKK